MLTDQTNSELGRHLLTIRGVQFIFGAQGDPFAMILRAGDDDPLDHGARAREQGLHESSVGAWVTAHRELGARILGDPRFSPRHAEEGPQSHPGVDVWDNPLLCHVVPLDDARLNLDPAAYAELAEVSAPLLSAEALAARAPQIEAAYRETLTATGERFDLYRDFAVPAALRVVADVLGLPAETRERLPELHAGLATALDAGHCPQQLGTARALLTAVSGLSAELTGLVDAGRATGLAGLSPEDAVAIGALAVVVGVEVTATAVCNAVEVLLAHPEQWQRIGQDPAAAPAAVREALRLAPPLRFESRIAREQVEFDGKTIEEGRRVVVLVDAANRDPEAFADPDAFTPGRGDGDRSLTLLGGPAAPVTDALVRVQTEAAVRALAALRPALRTNAEVLHRMRSAVLHGVLRFPVA
ncbi:cytochrome P450 family protein [Streptomyces violaceus]|uniref:P450-derived glycosyltransferase activator n=1 Tax=Streptomyces violaceus TaxID=1936 RepID=A0ABY9U8G5_STRVL|nr:P450-derived glycosyltransferase activator [Streptomyces janthinus]WND19173.1 P450-derived glycosyltransferase activator [Streptomyces janthinus]GGS93837.1 cytochrome P450 [Streptomyces janthinus]